MKKSQWIFFLLCMFSLTGVAGEKSSLVNFKHLEHLTEKIDFLGDTVEVIHVYSNYPDYQWVAAAESGLEGIACVDDASRAVVMYLHHYKLSHSEESLQRAKSLLKFILKMETDDGMFYNFILKDHAINSTGQTSFKSLGWWAARGVWSMATGYRVLKKSDPPFADELKRKIELTFPHIDSLFLNYNRFRFVDGYRIPKWLLYESGTDVTSELMLGLIEYYSATPAANVKSFVKKFAASLMAMQDGDVKTYPFGLHRSWQTMWHMWGNGQTQALAAAGKLLNDKRMIQSAEREAKGFYSRLLIDGFLKEMDVADSTKTARYEQIAYAVRPMVVGLLRLYEATNNQVYLKMAVLAASWFFGNNDLHQAMYDSATGRCFDGIKDSVTLNKNSGAESTIEALYTLVELEHYPQAKKYLSFRKVTKGSTPEYIYAVFKNVTDDELTLALNLKKASLHVFEGKESVKFRKKVIKG